MFTLICPAYGAILTWDGSNGNWDTDASWLPGGTEPGATDQVSIDFGTVAVTMLGELASDLSLGEGTLNVQAGGSLNAFISFIGRNPGSIGTAAVDGAGSTWTNAEDLFVGDAGNGTMTIQNSGMVSNVSGYIGNIATSTGTVTVDGVGSTWTNSANLRVGIGGNGTLNILNGGTVSAGGAGRIGDTAGATGTVTVGGVGSTWTISNDLFVGGNALQLGGTGSFSMLGQGLAELGGTLKIWGSGTVTMNGGTIALNALDIDPGGSMVFNSGTLNFTGNLSVTPTDSLQTALGGSHTVSLGQVLQVDGTTALNTVLTIGGGTFSTGDLINSPFLQFNTGTLRFTGVGGLTVGATGSFGSILTLTTGQNLEVTNTLTTDPSSLLVVESDAAMTAGTLVNNGELRLAGNTAMVNATTFNNTGLIRGEGRINSVVSNTGSIEAFDQIGELIFNEAATNEATGLIAVRNSTMRFRSGLLNQGQVSFGPGTSDLLGDVTNQSTIGFSSDAAVSLIGDLAQDGTLNLLTNAHLIVFNDYSGNGTTGPGTLEVLGTLSVGASPAAVTFGGDLTLGGGSTTLIEIGGLTSGNGFDQLNITGTATLGGVLELALINSFSPAPGDTFQIITASNIVGNFASVLASDLGSGLSWDTSSLLIDGMLSVVSTLTGDLDGDGFVGITDLNIVLGAWNQNAPPADQMADPSGDGFIGIEDLNMVLGNWNAGTPPEVEASGSIPEPSMLMLLALSSTTIVMRYRQVV